MWLPDFLSVQQPRINQLRSNKVAIEENGENDLTRFSFYHVSIEEIETFQQVLKQLRLLAEEVFADTEGDNIDYGLHYKKLLHIIEDRIGFDLATNEEKEFVQQLKERFEQIDKLEIKGNIEDLKETIYFYLQATDPDDDGSHWICRNFEQLDGGVLLRNERRSEFHLALLSNEKMNVRPNDLLPWPIDQDFIESYEKMEQNPTKLVLLGKKEYKNFLRYMLFYSTYYLSAKVHLSYVENSEGEKDTFYFLLDMLGLKPTRRENEDRNIDFTRTPRDVEAVDDLIPSSAEVLQDLAICDYRYFLNQIVRTGPYFRNDIHFRYYFSNLLLERVAKRRLEIQSPFIFKVILEEEFQKLRSFFPYWLDTDFFDMKELVEYLWITNGQSLSERYLNIRKRYLVAKIEGKQEENLMDDVLALANQNWNKYTSANDRVQKKLIRFKNTSALHEDDVDPLLCNYCNVKDLCLNFYKRGKYDE